MGCSESAPGPADDASVMWEEILVADTATTKDTQSPLADSDTPDDGDVGEQVDGDVGTAAPCETDADCPDGFCVPVDDSTLCTGPCVSDDECPLGFYCSEFMFWCFMTILLIPN